MHLETEPSRRSELSQFEDALKQVRTVLTFSGHRKVLRAPQRKCSTPTDAAKMIKQMIVFSRSLHELREIGARDNTSLNSVGRVCRELRVLPSQQDFS